LSESEKKQQEGKPAGKIQAKGTTMAEIPQENPCKECPFRKDSLRGYTGPYENMAEILAIVHFNGKFHCHMRVTALTKSGMSLENAGTQAAWCTGALAHMNNSCKRIEDQSVVNAAKMIGRRDDVFANPMEAMQYHDGNIRALMPPGCEMPIMPQGKPTKKKRR
jgi:hypothetical protein